MARSRPKSVQPQDLWPPPVPEDETEEEKAQRLEQELEAKRVSDQIDRDIEVERGELKKRRPDTKVLLLGQAESGKSTILKNFQLHFAPSTFKAEVAAWRAVIYLNLVKQVNFILNFLHDTTDLGLNSTQLQAAMADIPRLKISLSPLRGVEQMLARHLSADELPIDTSSSFSEARRIYQCDRASEFSIRSGSKWKLLTKKNSSNRHSHQDNLDSAQRIIEACKDDIIALWNSPVVQAGLRTENISLHEQSGFFLSEVDRVVNKDYMPSSDDILRARIQTIGVEEHRIPLETVADGAGEWVVYDVGGAKGQRPAWAPYFDDINVIIFLAPISAFNQTLVEDPDVNRLSDTFHLWTMICSNKLLAETQIIILLNKSDLLKAKLKAGIRFSDFVKSYTKPNDLKSVTKYLFSQFDTIHNHVSPDPKRRIHAHLTCAIDTPAMSHVLGKIQDVILTDHLKHANFI